MLRKIGKSKKKNPPRVTSRNTSFNKCSMIFCFKWFCCELWCTPQNNFFLGASGDLLSPAQFSILKLKPIVAKSVKTNLETLEWEVLPNLPYSPDVTPSDYHFCFDGWYTAWLISISALMKKTKNGLIRISPQKTHHFFEMEFENCLRDRKKS